MKNYSIRIVSEDAMLVEWDLDKELPTPEDAALIGSLANHLLTQYSQQIINVAPAYKTLLIQFDVLATDIDSVQGWVKNGIETQQQSRGAATPATLHQIPTYYDPSVAADLADLCRAREISVEKLIEEHTALIYTVYSVGFQPGFAYLGYVSKVLATPRHSSFRGKVPAGSVGIADRQTAVYPMASPGGWQIVGRTPMPLLENNHAVLQAGDRVQFISINRADYIALGGTLTSTVRPLEKT